MNFFKSVFSPDPDLSESHQHQSPNSPQQLPPPPNEGEEEEEEEPKMESTWGFGGLIKSLASRSESVIHTYRRDLEEFGSGLKKETAAIREAAARAVLDLPGSLEAGASVAQESLESVGQAIDDFGGSVWRGTAEIISQSKDALLPVDDSETEDSTPPDSNARRFGRFEVRVFAIQSDQSTFLEDPEDSEDFRSWKDGFFRIEEKQKEMEELCAENGALRGMLEKLVPRSVDYETFWSRYFYKVYKLKQAEDARAKLVKRVIAREEEEEDLSWEVDDDDDNEEEDAQKKVIEDEGNRPVTDVEVKSAEVVEENSRVESVAEEEEPTDKSQIQNVVDKASSVLSKEDESEGKVESLESIVQEDQVTKSDDKAASDAVESGKDSDISIVSTQQSMHEEDLEWDEIEDLGENDEKKATVSSPNKNDLRKRLSVTEDDEDLSWDIEDD